MMTEQEAVAWSLDMCENGTYPARKAYIEQYPIGSMARDKWDDPLFTFGIEYGILIAVAKIYRRLAENGVKVE